MTIPRIKPPVDFVSLRDYLDMRIDAVDAADRERAQLARTAVDAALIAAEKAISAALAAAEKAVLKAEAAQEKRMEGLNEFRAAMMDQQKGLAPKTETDLRFEMLDRRVTENSDKLMMMGGKSQGVSASFGVTVQIIASIAAVIGIAVVILTR